jgi:hypothetical protein
MSSSEMSFLFSLYIRGVKMNPQIITSILNTQPIYSHVNGEEKIFKSGKKIIRKESIWVIEVSTSIGSINNCIDMFFYNYINIDKILDEQKIIFSLLPDVDQADLDIYIQRAGPAKSSEIPFQFSGKSLQKISRFNLPLDFTVDWVDFPVLK